MSEAAEKLMADLLKLPESERLEIADLIYASLPPPPGVASEDDPIFDAMLRRRIEDLETGRVVGIPAEQVMQRLREKYAK